MAANHKPPIVSSPQMKPTHKSPNFLTSVNTQRVVLTVSPTVYRSYWLSWTINGNHANSTNYLWALTVRCPSGAPCLARWAHSQSRFPWAGSLITPPSGKDGTPCMELGSQTTGRCLAMEQTWSSPRLFTMKHQKSSKTFFPSREGTIKNRFSFTKIQRYCFEVQLDKFGSLLIALKNTPFFSLLLLISLHFIANNYNSPFFST